MVWHSHGPGRRDRFAGHSAGSVVGLDDDEAGGFGRNYLDLLAVRRRLVWRAWSHSGDDRLDFSSLTDHVGSHRRFFFLTFADWLALPDRLQSYAVVILAAGLATVCVRRVRSHQEMALRFWQRSFAWVVGGAVLASLGIQGGLWLSERIAIATLPVASKNFPNILLIIIDTLRADHLSSYGYGRPTSPNIDRLAKEGVLFKYAVSASAWTPPSHASILTGRYPHEHGVEWNKAFDDRYPTIAEALRDVGYRTAAFSANPFGFNRKWGFGRGFIRFEDHFHSLFDMVARTLYGRKILPLILRWLGFEDWIARKRAYHVNRSLLKWMARDQDKPFFAVLNYFDLHDPYLPPQPYRHRFSKLQNPGGILNSVARRYFPQLAPVDLEGEMAAYDGAIAYVDDHINQLLIALQNNNILGKTLIVITSDHGEMFGEHGLFFHQNALYLPLIRVPLIFWWPRQIPGGVEIVAPVSNVALPSTLMDLIGMKEQQLFPGASLTKLWNDAAKPNSQPCPLSEIALQPFWPLKDSPVYSGAMKSVLNSRWHYVVHGKRGAELYDMSRDPEELHNLAKLQEHQNTIRRFELILNDELTGDREAACED